MGRRGSVAYENPWAVQTARKGNPDPVAAVLGPVSWKPLPTLGFAPLQIGVYGEPLLSQFPALYNQPQLHQGVEGLQSAWYTPSQSPNPTFQQTQRPTNIAGGQRYGQNAGGPLGPLSAKKLAQRVASAQVRQSGLTAQQWATGLSGG